ncbi:MAG: cell division protein FtsQ/DivIB [Alphaproteobacteria bacterium]
MSISVKKKTVSKSGRPRRRVIPLWRGRRAMALAAIIVIASVGGGGWWTVREGHAGRVIDKVKWELIAFTGSLGFTVEDVLVIGRSQTTRDDLLKAVRLARGAPIMAFELSAAQKRIEELDWVRSASVERMLPDTILLSVVERMPLALWQDKGRFQLIDRDGEVILREGLGRFSDLLVVVGEDAPENASELLDVLQTQPRLMDQVVSAFRVGGRRWNVRLKGGIDVRLPAEAADAAWTRLAEYEARHGVLRRDVRVLDLRLPDRLIVKKGTNSKPEFFRSGQET